MYGKDEENAVLYGGPSIVKLSKYQNVLSFSFHLKKYQWPKIKIFSAFFWRFNENEKKIFRDLATFTVNSKQNGIGTKLTSDDMPPCLRKLTLS